MNKALPTAVFLAVFAFFLIRTAPAAAPLDSAELAAAGSTLGIAHPPGYPLYVMAGRLWASLPAGNGALRLNVFSGFCTALSAAALSRFLLLYGAGFLGALTGAAALVLPLPIQRLSISAEVFGLHLFTLTLFIACLWSAVSLRSLRWLFAAAFMSGLGLANQHLAVFSLPLLAGGVWLLRKQFKAEHAPWFAFLFILPLLLYLYLPIRSLQSPALNWEEPSTWERFWSVVLRHRYGTLQLAQGAQAWTFSTVVGTQQLLGGLLWNALGPAWIAAAAFGAALQFKRDNRTFWGLFLLGLLSGPCFFAMAKLGPGPNARMIMERFLPTVLLVLAVWIGYAAGRSRWVGILALAGLLWHGPASWPQARAAFITHDLGMAHLRSLPKGSLLIAERADEVEFTLAYLHSAEGRRPDIRFLDANAGVTPSIYGQDYYGIWGPPRLRRREEIESRLINAWPGPAYYATLEPEMISIQRSRSGVLFQAKGPKTATDWTSVLAVRNRPSTEREALLLETFERLLAQDALEKGRTAAARRAILRSAGRSSEPGKRLQEAAAHAFAAGIFDLSAELGRRASGFERSVLTLTNLGAALERMGKPEEAVKVLNEAAEMDPSNRQTLFNLGAACWAAGDKKCALDAFRRNLAISPDDPAAKRWVLRLERR